MVKEIASTHTPGPLTVSEDNYAGSVFVRRRWHVKHEETGIYTADNLLESDARLYAAAPDLLAALTECWQMAPNHGADCSGRVVSDEGAIFEQMEGCDCYLSRAKAAIDKARGAQ